MLRTHESRTQIDAPARSAFDWHTRPGAFERLAPPWEELRVVRKSGGIRDGDELVFKIRIGPGVWWTWQARHFGYEEGVRFCDEQVRGPFAVWKHEHRFDPIGDERCELVDKVQYALPLEPLGRLAPKCLAEGKIEAMFAYRTAVTKRDIELHWKAQAPPLRVAMTGSSGLVGSALTPFLTAGGHTVVPMVRSKRKAAETPDAVHWSPREGLSAESRRALEGIDAVVHLAGESILGVWTADKKHRIRDSRVEGTRALCEGLAALEKKPKVLVCASAVGFYGDRGDEEVTEESASGEGFLAEVAREWEQATAPAREAGIRVVTIRIGVVLSPKGGALAAMLPAFNFGVGGRLGAGRQYMSWIALDDLVGLFHHALVNDSVEGPLNGTAPNPVRNRELTATLASVLNRPAFLPAPRFALSALPGGMGTEVFLASLRVLPQKALQTGYEFALPDLDAALRHLLGRQRPTSSTAPQATKRSSP